MKLGRLRFLGTGNSTGVPVIGCKCGVCRSGDPKNVRSRPGALLEVEGKSIAIDVSQDFRTQALRYEINQLDGLILTHPHYDHIAGLDDLRIYYIWSKKPIACLASRFTADDIRRRYDYMFNPKLNHGKLVTKIDIQELENERGNTEFLGLMVNYFTYYQREMPVTGFRLGTFAYVTDIRDYPETIFEDLRGVDTLVISAMARKLTPLHFGLEEAKAFADQAGVRQTWLTHVSHDIDHLPTNHELPADVQVAFDGMEIEVELD